MFIFLWWRQTSHFKVCVVGVARSLLRPRKRLRSIVMTTSVCLSVCPTGYLRNRTRDLYQIFVHVAYVRGSSFSGTLTIGRIAYRRERGDWSAQRGGSVIYHCLVQILGPSWLPSERLKLCVSNLVESGKRKTQHDKCPKMARLGSCDLVLFW